MSEPFPPMPNAPGEADFHPGSEKPGPPAVWLPPPPPLKLKYAFPGAPVLPPPAPPLAPLAPPPPPPATTILLVHLILILLVSNGSSEGETLL